MTSPPDVDELNLARIETRLLEWMRAGRETYKREALGDAPCNPSDIIRTAEETK